MIQNPIARKLGLKREMRAFITGAPPEYLARLDPLPEGVTISGEMRGPCEFIQFFAVRKAEIERLAPALVEQAARGALVWITYPKKTSQVTSDLSREEVRDAMETAGWRAVSIIAIDDVWPALRFRPAGDVKSRPVRNAQ